MPTISSITARQILDSRGRPTIEATVSLSDGTVATSSVPSGSVSNEQIEAMELRDHNSAEYFGYGVSKAVELINTEISSKLAGLDPLYQTKVDQTLVDLDGTKNKSRLGSNSILAVSQAVLKASAASLHLPLFVYIKEKYQLIDAYRIPTPIFNLINGGQHGGGTLDFQEFQLVPASHLPYEQALKIGTEMFMAVGQVLEQKGALTSVGLEGGYAPNLASNSDALEIFNEAAKVSGYTISKDAFLGIDLGPQNFYKNGKYTIKDKSQPMSGKDFIKYLKGLHEQYRVFALEDPLMPDAWSDWKIITAELGQTAMIMADDLVATNKTLLMKAIEEKACNALVIKPNRVGTITEAIEIASLAKNAGWHTVMSHRSSETTDDVLADVAVGIGTDYVKFGAPSRGERVVKYNRLLRIEEILRASSGQTSNTPPERTDMSAAQPQNQPEPAAPATDSPAQSAPAAQVAATPVVTPEPAAQQPEPATTDPTQPQPDQVSTFTQPAPAQEPTTQPISPVAPAAIQPSPQPAPVATPAAVPVVTPEPATVQQQPEPEISLTVPTQPTPPPAPAEVFADSPEPVQSAPTETATVQPSQAQPASNISAALNPDLPEDAAEEVIQDSLNELVQMVESVPLEDQTANVTETKETTQPASSAPIANPQPAAQAPSYAGPNLATSTPQATETPTPSSPPASPMAAPVAPTPPAAASQPTSVPQATTAPPTTAASTTSNESPDDSSLSGLPKPTPPSY